jgi:ATP-dependent metalloprotease FtsH
MLAFQVLQAILNILLQLIQILVQGIVYALGFLLIFVGGTGLGRSQTQQIKGRRWFWQKRNLEQEVRFEDIIGLDEAKQELQQLVDLLRRPENYRTLGAESPKGILLVGPPGTGKTMLARAIANEAGVPFFSLVSADFANMFLGVGALRVRQIYREARRHPQAIVFIDELETLAKARNSGLGNFGGGDSNTLSAFLGELDGFKAQSNVITLGATNSVEQIDAAILRPGRLDWQIYIGPPDEADREKLFTFYLGRIQSDADSLKGAKLAVNFTPAEVRRAVNEAGLIAVREGKAKISDLHLSAGIDRVSATLERKVGTFVISRPGDVRVAMGDVIGCEEAKSEVQEYVDFLKHPEKFRRIGAKVPRGFLFVGPPGTGKTLLAKAIANTAGVPFYVLSGADFVEVFSGVGASRIRQVYSQARRHRSAIVFIDEIDALAAKRGGRGDADQTLNQFLVELDGFGRSNVLTIGATNRLDTLDPALLRPGRLDRTVLVPLPDLEAREQLFSHYLNTVQTIPGINCRQLARTTWNLSGAEIAAAVNEASFIALRNEREQVNQFDLNQGIERIKFGLSSRRKVNAEDRRLVAIHEAGHAIVEHYARPERTLHKLTIVPNLQGIAGYSWSLGDENQLSFETREQLLAEIQVLFGGRVAEEEFFGTVTTGAKEDLARAAQLAHQFIWELGMGEEFVASLQKEQLADQTRQRLDIQVNTLLVEAKERSRKILRDHAQEHARLCETLLERESLYGDEILQVLRLSAFSPESE